MTAYFSFGADMGFINHLYSGRIGRLHFAVLAIVMLIVNVVTGKYVISGLTMHFGSLGALIGLLFGFAVAIMTLHLYVRRFHDINMSGWWVAVMVAANFFSVLLGNILTLLFIILLSAKMGSSGPNAYGGVPRHHSFVDAFLNQ